MGKRRLERPNAYRRIVNNAEVCYRSTSPDLKEGEALTLSSERRGDGLSRSTVSRESAFQTNREKNDQIKSLISALTFAGGLHLEPLTGGKAAKGGRGRRGAHCDSSACGRRLGARSAHVHVISQFPRDLFPTSWSQPDMTLHKIPTHVNVPLKPHRA